MDRLQATIPGNFPLSVPYGPMPAGRVSSCHLHPWETGMTTLHDFTLTDIDGEQMPLQRFAGRVVLVVNVASRCGLTPQYAALEQLYRELRDDGLSVLGIPCNQFAGQEPGTEADIKSFCSTRFDVSFPMASKTDVNGEGRHPLYEWLAGAGSAFPGDIRWNFEKFLVDRHGHVVARLGPRVEPDSDELVTAVRESLR
jgi:glutathione peroxidase